MKFLHPEKHPWAALYNVLCRTLSKGQMKGISVIFVTSGLDYGIPNSIVFTQNSSIVFTQLMGEVALSGDSVLKSSMFYVKFFSMF